MTPALNPPPPPQGVSNVVCVTLCPAVSHVNLEATVQCVYLYSCGTVCDVSELCTGMKRRIRCQGGARGEGRWAMGDGRWAMGDR